MDSLMVLCSIVVAEVVPILRIQKKSRKLVLIPILGSQGRMATLISHRVSTVKIADRTFIINHSRIVECGTRQKLATKQAPRPNSLKSNSNITGSFLRTIAPQRTF